MCNHEHDRDAREDGPRRAHHTLSMFFGSNYHEHDGEPCDQEHHSTCPAADAVFCTPLSNGLNGCTELWFSASLAPAEATGKEICEFAKAVNLATLKLLKREPKSIRECREDGS